MGVIKGDARSLDYGSCGHRGHHTSYCQYWPHLRTFNVGHRGPFLSLVSRNPCPLHYVGNITVAHMEGWIWNTVGIHSHEQVPRTGAHAFLGRSRPARRTNGGNSGNLHRIMVL